MTTIAGLCVILLSVGAAQLHAEEPLDVLMRDYCTFKVGFDHGDVNADIARGDERGKLVGPTPVFQNGIRGQALLLDASSAKGVNYAARDNFNLSKPGAVSFWIQPVKWLRGEELPDNPKVSGQKEVSYSLFFMTPYSETGFIGLERMTPAWSRFPDRMVFYSAKFAGAKNAQIHAPMPWGDGEWHHAVLTWDRQEFSLYLDGQRAGGIMLQKPVEENACPESFMVGGGSPSDTSTLIDEFCIFSKRLTDQEVGLLYANDFQQKPKDKESENSTLAHFKDALSFFCSFDNETVAADLAIGPKEPLTLKGKAVFRLGKRGKSLQLDKGGAQVDYAYVKNADMLQPGAASMWVARDEWSYPPDASSHQYQFLLRMQRQWRLDYGEAFTIGRMGSFIKSMQSDSPFVMIGRQFPNMKAGSCRPGNLLEWKRGEWHLVAVNWDSKGCAISLDGGPFNHMDFSRSLREDDFPQMETLVPNSGKGVWLTLGGKSSESTLIDEVAIYRRCLDNADLQWLMKNGK